MTDQKTKRLRVAHVIVQPVLVYDDGEELTPGPSMATTQACLSELAALADEISAAVAAENAKLVGPEPLPRPD